MKSLLGISSRPSDPVVMCQKRCSHSTVFWVLSQRACPLCSVSEPQDCAHRPCLILSCPPVHRRPLGFSSLLASWTLAAFPSMLLCDWLVMDSLRAGTSCTRCSLRSDCGLSEQMAFELGILLWTDEVRPRLRPSCSLHPWYFSHMCGISMRRQKRCIFSCLSVCLSSCSPLPSISFFLHTSLSILASTCNIFFFFFLAILPSDTTFSITLSGPRRNLTPECDLSSSLFFFSWTHFCPRFLKAPSCSVHRMDSLILKVRRDAIDCEVCLDTREKES